MDKLVYLVYPVLLFISLWKIKLIKNDEAGDDYLSIERTKPVLGLTSLFIVLHHISQETSAPWLKDEYRMQGLEFFVPLGYVCVSLFFFISGFGLYKSYLNKEDYLRRFLRRRVAKVLVPFVLIDIIYLCVNAWFEYVGFPINPYSWYIIAITVFYLGFYIILKLFPKAFFVLMPIVVLGYCLVCSYLYLGSWWINSVVAFLLGILMAYREKKIYEIIKKKYILIVSAALILFLLCYIVADNRWMLYALLGNNTDLGLIKGITLFLQIIASMLTCVLLVCVLMKVRLGNKITVFLGEITVELYLIHGLFVQLFNRYYMAEYMKPICHISNISLYVLAVLAISIPLARLLNGASKYVHKNLFRESVVRDAAFGLRDSLITAMVIGIVIIFISFTASSSNYNKMQPDTIAMKEKTITLVDIDGENMSAYCIGEGDNIMVMIGDPEDPCTTLSLRRFSKQLSDNFKVIILDYLGNGFSDDTIRVRNSESVVEEIDTALTKLGVSEPFVLFSYNKAGLYSVEYANSHPERIKAIISYDHRDAHYFEKQRIFKDYSVKGFINYSERMAQIDLVLGRINRVIGFDKWRAERDERLYPEEYRFCMVEKILERNKRSGSFNLMENIYTDSLKDNNNQYPSSVPVMLLYDSLSVNKKAEDIDWLELSERSLSNKDIQKVKVMELDTYTLKRLETFQNNGVNLLFIKSSTIQDEINIFLNDSGICQYEYKIMNKAN